MACDIFSQKFMVIIIHLFDIRVLNLHKETGARNWAKKLSLAYVTYRNGVYWQLISARIDIKSIQNFVDFVLKHLI